MYGWLYTSVLADTVVSLIKDTDIVPAPPTECLVSKYIYVETNSSQRQTNLLGHKHVGPSHALRRFTDHSDYIKNNEL